MRMLHRISAITLFGLFLIRIPLFAQEIQEKIQSFIDLAEQNYNEKNYKEALINTDSVLSLNPDHGKAYLIRGNIYFEQDNYRRAINEYNNAIRFEPNNPEAYYKRSQVRHKVGDHRNYSLNDINKAIELDPENVNYYLKKALYLTSSSYPAPEYNLAIETISKAIKIQPEKADFYHIRARYKSEAGQRLASLTDFTKAIELDSMNADYYFDRGLVYFLIEDYLSAINDLNSAIQLDPANGSYLLTRGQARFNLNDYETAILDFTLSIENIYKEISQVPGKITPDHELNKLLRRAYLYRGQALLQDESTYEACEDFEAAATLGDVQASNFISRYCQ